MKISIIIPVYNVEKYIVECLRSIMDQTYSDFECLIIDDCGSDKSIEIAKSAISEYTGKGTFEIIKNEKNGGISVARNNGLKRATGDFVFFLDSDDKLCPNSLELLISMVERHPGVDVVQGNIQCERKSDYWNIRGKFPEYTSDRNWIREQILLWKIPVSVWGKLYRRNLLISNNIIFMEGYMHEDVAWNYKLQKYISSIAFVDEFCYYYRTDNNGSIMHNTDKTHSFISYLELYKRAAIEAETLPEKKFVFNLFSPSKIVRAYRTSKYTDKINAKIDEILTLFQSSSVDHFFVSQLKLFKWPLFVLNNPIFDKCYYLWSKKNGLV